MNFMLDFLSLDLQIKHCSVTIYVPVFELNKWTSPSPVVAWIKQIKYYYIDINNIMNYLHINENHWPFVLSLTYSPIYN